MLSILCRYKLGYFKSDTIQKHLILPVLLPLMAKVSIPLHASTDI